jgi:hypothetical protein
MQVAWVGQGCLVDPACLNRIKAPEEEDEYRGIE